MGASGGPFGLPARVPRQEPPEPRVLNVTDPLTPGSPVRKRTSHVLSARHQDRQVDSARCAASDRLRSPPPRQRKPCSPSPAAVQRPAPSTRAGPPATNRRGRRRTGGAGDEPAGPAENRRRPPPPTPPDAAPGSLSG